MGFWYIDGKELDRTGGKVPRGFHWLQATDRYKRTSPLDVLRRVDQKWIRCYFSLPPSGGIIRKRFFTRAGAEGAAAPGEIVRSVPELLRITGGSRSPFKP